MISRGLAGEHPPTNPLVVLKAARWWYIHRKGGSDPAFRRAIEWARHLATDTPSDIERFDDFLEYLVTVGFADNCHNRGQLDLVTTMATTSDSSVSFEETDTRSGEISSTIEQWIDEFVAGVDDAQASEVPGVVRHQESLARPLLPEHAPHQTAVPRGDLRRGLSNVAGGVRPPPRRGGVSYLDLGPIIAKQCPECGNSPSYHEDSLQTQTDIV